MARLTPFPTNQELDSNGNPLAGGKIYTYEAGTTTPKTTYTSADETSANTNPIILDAAGRSNIWLESGAYKIRIFDALDNLIDERDDVIAQDAGEATSYDITTNTNITALYNNARLYANGSLTLSLLPTSEAEDGFEFITRNIGTSDIIIDPDSLETIDGNTTLTLKPGKALRIMCDGDEWFTFGIATDIQPLDDTLTALAGTLTAANKIPYATATDTAGELDFLDEDDLTSDSDTALASQQSIKAYVDTQIAAHPNITLGTAIAATTGTAIDFTALPADIKRVTINFANVSTNGTSNWLVQLGDSGGFETTGYTAVAHKNGVSTLSSTSGFLVNLSVLAANAHTGRIVLERIDTNQFISSGSILRDSLTAPDCVSSGTKTLSSELTQIRITTAGGTDSFDAGKINITYER